MRRISVLLALLPAVAAVACSDSSGGGSEQPPVDEWPIDSKTGLRVAAIGPVPPLPEWADNPPTEEKKELGRALFFDNRNSGSGTAACGNCHLSIVDFQSGSPLDLPDRSYPNIEPTLRRNAPSLLNVIYAPMMRYDGAHFTNLYEMMVLPYAEANMNLSVGIPPEDVDTIDIPSAQEHLKQKLTENAPGYVDAFQKAFDVDIRELSSEEVWLLAGKATAVYLRIAVSRDAPFDRWNTGDDDAMDASAVRGLSVFMGRGGCISCHSGPFLSDFQFHNVSTSTPGEDGTRPDEGRYLVTKKEEDRGAFLTSMLRSSSMTSPYLHNGSETALAKVVLHMSGEYSLRDPLHDPRLNATNELTDEEVEDLVSFLKALRGAELPDEDLAPPATYP